MIYGKRRRMSIRAAIRRPPRGGPLDQIVSFAGIRRKAAFRTSGQVYLLGTPGSVVPQGTILETNEGAEVETSQEATLTAGVAPVMTSV